MFDRNDRRAALALLGICGALCGCSSSSPPSASPGDGGGEAKSGPVARGGRYCEILVGNLSGTTVNIKVYSTVGLNDCPDAEWSALDESALKSSLGASAVVLNGPRYWTIDSAAGSALQDPTIVAFGDIEMRQAGAIALPIMAASTVKKPYTTHTIQRKSTFSWYAGRPVFELVSVDGHVCGFRPS